MSALYAVVVALDTLVTADTVLQELGATFYAGEAPASAGIPRIVWDDANQLKQHRLGRKGATPTVTLHLWDRDHVRVANLFSQLHRLLDLQPLTVEGHIVDRADLSLVSIISDPSGHSHGIAEYAVMTKEADVETSP